MTTHHACPACHTPLAQDAKKENLYRCAPCSKDYLLTDAGLELWSDEEQPSAVKKYLFYTLSLPERAARSTIGVAAGAAKGTAGFLVPQSFQSSTTYDIVIRKSLNFLTENVGGVAPEPGSEQAGDDYVARKTVGNFVDFAGLATLHVSPLWIMAIVSDVAYGSKAYVKELAVELEKQGLISETSSIHHVDDVLEALQNSTGQASTLFDTPPLSVAELKETLAKTRDSIKSTNYREVLPEAELKKYWEEMRELAGKEDVSLLSISGAMSMHTLNKVKTVSQGTLTGVRVAGGLLNRHVIGHYRESLVTIRKEGFYETVKEHSGPYVEAVWNNFSKDKSTLTEEVVSGRLFAKVGHKVKGLFKKKEELAESETNAGTEASTNENTGVTQKE